MKNPRNRCIPRKEGLGMVFIRTDVGLETKLCLTSPITEAHFLSFSNSLSEPVLNHLWLTFQGSKVFFQATELTC